MNSHSDNIALPRISLVVPSFNQGEFLSEALDSALDQDYANLELIVMDGGSTDGKTLEVLNKYNDRLTYWQSRPDSGQSDAINSGLSRASGEIFGWLCCDDLLKAGTLKLVGEYFRQNSDCRWLAGAGEIIYIEEGRKTIAHSGLENSDSLLDFWLWGAGGHYICQPSCFWHRSLWLDSGGLNVDNHLAMDFELWLRFSSLAGLHTVDDCLSVSRIHAQCKSGGNRREQVRQTMHSAYEAAAAKGISKAGFTVHLLSGLLAMRASRFRKNLRDRWLGGACREAIGISCDLLRVWCEAGRMNALRYM